MENENFTWETEREEHRQKNMYMAGFLGKIQSMIKEKKGTDDIYDVLQNMRAQLTYQFGEGYPDVPSLEDFK